MHEPIPLAFSPMGDFACATGRHVLAGNPDKTAFRSDKFTEADNKCATLPFFETGFDILSTCLLTHVLLGSHSAIWRCRASWTYPM